MFSTLGTTWSTIIANLIGGMIFYFVDKFIFQSEVLDASWQVKERVKCADCQAVTRGYRIVKSKNYDKSHDKYPEFRCETCSIAKTHKMRKDGVFVEIL